MTRRAKSRFRHAATSRPAPATPPRWLRAAAWVAVGVCVVMQLLFTLVWAPATQLGDCAVHVELAEAAWREGAWYPTAANLYDGYLLAPTLINLLVAQLRLFGTTGGNWVINLALCLLVTWEVYWLARRLFTERVACVAVILYSMLYSTWTCVFPAATEVPFVAGVMSALCLAVAGGWWRLALAGVLIALANGIRPLAVFFVPTMVLLMMARRARRAEYVWGLAACLAVVGAMGLRVQRETGYFKTSSTTGGLNLLLTANDKSTGSLPPDYNDPRFADMRLDEDKGLDYVQQDKARTARAVDWIIRHPGRWAALYVKKVGILYFHDVAFGGYYGIGASKVQVEAAGGSYLQVALKRAACSVTYYAMMVMFMLSVWRNRRLLFSRQGALLLIPLLGTLGTCVFQTMARYHFPFNPVFAIWAAALFLRPGFRAR